MSSWRPCLRLKSSSFWIWSNEDSMCCRSSSSSSSKNRPRYLTAKRERFGWLIEKHLLFFIKTEVLLQCFVQLFSVVEPGVGAVLVIIVHDEIGHFFVVFIVRIVNRTLPRWKPGWSMAVVHSVGWCGRRWLVSIDGTMISRRHAVRLFDMSRRCDRFRSVVEHGFRFRGYHRRSFRCGR